MFKLKILERCARLIQRNKNTAAAAQQWRYAMFMKFIFISPLSQPLKEAYNKKKKKQHQHSDDDARQHSQEEIRIIRKKIIFLYRYLMFPPRFRSNFALTSPSHFSTLMIFIFSCCWFFPFFFLGKKFSFLFFSEHWEGV